MAIKEETLKIKDEVEKMKKDIELDSNSVYLITKEKNTLKHLLYAILGFFFGFSIFACIYVKSSLDGLKIGINKVNDNVLELKNAEDKARHIVEDMLPYHQKWTIEQTTDVMDKYGLNLDKINFYLVMNSAFNDYHEMFDEDLDKYVMYSKLWLEDKDAVEDKVYEYFMNIPK